MKPEKWQRLDELFHLALEHEGEARVSFVRQASDGDEDLRFELATMLDHYDRAKSFIESPAYVLTAETIVEEEPEQLVGSTLGPYRMLGVLGKGGMGVVYRALDQELQRKVALKFLHSDLTADKSRILRFKQEARAASALNHPNILTVYAIGEIEGNHYIATELVEGETLREVMKSRRMNVGQILDVISQISSAISTAHAAGIMHRDIKPENIMLRPDGYLKVLDFGLAKLIEPGLTDSGLSTLINTEQGTIIGTIQYMSPEQARGMTVDERTDIWSLGIVLFEMLTGHPPFEGKTKSDVMAAILEHEPPTLSSVNVGGPEQLQRILDKALSKDPEARYQTVEDFLSDVRKLDESKTRTDLEMPLLYGVNKHVVTETAKQRARSTDDPGAIRPSFSAEYLVSEMKDHKIGVGIVLTLLVAAFAGAVLIKGRLTSPNTPSQFQSMSLTRLTNGVKVQTAAISPDGNYVAYVKVDGDKRSLWLRQVGTTSNVEISQKTDAGWVTFSPNGAQIYYRTFLRDLYRMPVLGGPPTLLLKSVDSSIAFSPDGRRFAFLRSDYPAPGQTSLLVANADGNEHRNIASLTGPDSLERAVAWSPDGRLISCAVKHQDGGASFTTVVHVDAETGRVEPLGARRWDEIDDLTWLSDGRGLLVLATEEGYFFGKIWMISYPNGEERKITNDFSIYGALGLTANSKKIVTIQRTQAANIWISPTGLTSAAQRITSQSSNYLGFSWTGDGRLVYASDATGNWDIWIRGPNALNERQLTINQNANLIPVVSPDSRYVFFTSNRSGSFNIWRMDIDGSNPKQLTHGDLDHSPSCSPDGRWLIYVHEASNKSTIWKVAIDGGSPLQLSDSEAAYPVFSPDGKLIACSYGDNKVAVIPNDGGQPLRIFDIPTPFVIEPGVRWSSDGRALVFVDTKEGISNLWSQSLDGGPRKQLTNFQSDEIFSFALSRDGKQLSLARGTEIGDIVLISDFR